MTLNDIANLKRLFEKYSLFDAFIHILAKNSKKFLILTGNIAYESCFTVIPNKSYHNMIISYIEAWYDRERIALCTKEAAKLAYDRMVFDLKNNVDNLTSSIYLLSQGIRIGNQSIQYFSARITIIRRMNDLDHNKKISP